MTPSTTNTAAREVVQEMRSVSIAARRDGNSVISAYADKWADQIEATLTQQQGGEQDAGDCLPELPEPNRVIEGAMASMDVDLFTTDQMRAYATAALRSKPAASEGGGAKVAELKAALSRAVEIDTELHTRLQAVQRDRDEKDVRHFNEMCELRRDRDNLSERVRILTSKQAAGEAVAVGRLILPYPPGRGVILKSAHPIGATQIIPNENALSLPPGEHPLYTTPPRHPADEGASANSYYAEKAREQRDVAVLDKYADIARALGFPCDTWFGDPLASHEDIVARAKALAALQAGTP